MLVHLQYSRHLVVQLHEETINSSSLLSINLKVLQLLPIHLIAQVLRRQLVLFLIFVSSILVDSIQNFLSLIVFNRLEILRDHKLTLLVLNMQLKFIMVFQLQEMVKVV